MKKTGTGKSIEAAQKAHLRRARMAQRVARPRERVDLILGVLAAMGLAVTVGIGSLLAYVENVQGMGDPHVLRPVPDNRLLTNLRDSDSPFIGAAALEGGHGQVALVRQDGTVGLFDPTRELMDSETLPLEDPNITGTPVIAASACGWIDRPEGVAACDRPEDAFVLTDKGGLLRRERGRWSVYLPDTQWVGLHGTPVEQNEVKAWAVSDDGDAVLVYAGTQGAALFDRDALAWQPVAQADSLAEAQGSDAVTMLYHDRRFWFASRTGLAQIDPNTPTPQVVWSENQNRRFIDLEVSGDGSLLALTEAGCSRGGGTCLAISRVQDLNALALVAGETVRPAQLSAQSVERALIQNDRVVTVGQAGVHAYNSVARTWSVLFDRRPDAFLVRQDRSISVIQGDTLLSVSGARIASRTTVQGGPYRALLSLGSSLAGVTPDGEIRALPSGDTLLGDAGRLPDGFTVLSGASLGEFALLVGNSGIALHDMARRELSYIPVDQLEPPLNRLPSGRIPVLAADGSFWVMSPESGEVGQLAMAGTGQVLTPSIVALGKFAAPLRSFAALADGLHLVDAEGVSHRVRSAQAPAEGVAQLNRSSPIGPPLSRPTSFTLAASHAGGIYFANAAGIWNYDRARRAWDAPITPPEGIRIAEIAQGDALYLRSTAGRVYRRQGSGWATVLDGGGAALALSQLTDAQGSDSHAFLAGAGRVQLYDIARGALAQVWDGGTGKASLVSTELGYPIWVSGGQLLNGDTPVQRNVVEAWRTGAGILAMVEEGGRNRSVFYSQFPNNPVCTHGGAPAPGGNFIDAVGIGERVFALTSNGAALHDPQTRRWIRVTGLPSDSATRLYTTSSHLVAVTPNSLRRVRLSEVVPPQSCAPAAMSLDFDLTSGVSVAFSRSGVAILSADGQARIWQDGQFSQLLPPIAPSGIAPTPGRFLDFADFSAAGKIAFAAPDALWVYDLSSRTWHRMRLLLPENTGRIVEVDVAAKGAEQADVTIWSESGASFGGAFDSLNQEAVRLGVQSPVTSLPHIATAPANITAMSERDGVWAIGSLNGLEIGRGTDEALPGRLNFADPVDPIPRAWGGVTRLQTGSSAAPDRLYLIPEGFDLAGQKTTLAEASLTYSPGDDRAYGLSDDSSTLMRITQDGAVQACPVRAGASASADCSIQFPAPLRMERVDIARAFVLRGVTFYVRDGRLYQLDADLRTEIEIQGPDVSGPDLRVFTSAGKPLLLEGMGQRLWTVDLSFGSDQRVEFREVASDVKGFKVSDTGAVMVQSGPDRLRIAAQGARVSLVPDTDLTFDWFGGTGGYRISEDGRLSWRGGSSPIRPRAPEEIVDAFSLPALPLGPSPVTEAIATLRDHAGTRYLEIHGRRLCSQLRADLPPRAFEAVCGTGQERLSMPLLSAAIPLGNPGDLQGVSLSGTELELYFDQSQVTVDLASETVSGRAAPRVLPIDTEQIDTTQSLRSLILPGPSGVGELNPPKISRSGNVARLVLENNRGAQDLLPEPTPWVPLRTNVFWWEESLAQIAFNGPSGPVVMPAEEAIIDGRFLPAWPGNGARLPNGGHSWLTDHSLWHFNPGRAGLVLVARGDFAKRVALDSGLYHLEDGQTVDRGSGRLAPIAAPAPRSFAALTVTEGRATQAIDVSYARDTGPEVPAFAASGFAHDDRRAIGWSNGAPVLVTPSGLVSARRLVPAEVSPQGAPPNRILTRDAQTYALQGNTWSQRQSPGRWTTVPDPTIQRQLATGADGRNWRVGPGGDLQITARDPAEGWRVARSGLDFQMDELVALAATRGTVLLGTRAGTHANTDGTGLWQMTAPLDASGVSAPFQRWTDATGREVLRNGQAQVWGGSTWRVAQAAERLWDSRRALDGPLRLDLTAGNAPSAARTITQPDGTLRYASFGWGRGEAFPFDIATALGAGRGALWVGTEAGLRPRTGTTWDLWALRQLVPSDRSPAESVARIGTPDTDRTRTLARGANNGCITVTPSRAPCRDPDLLDTTFVFEDSFWHWAAQPGRVTGAYKVTNARLGVRPDSVRRWPHDTLQSALHCKGRRLELWANSNVLNEDGRLTQLPRGPWDRFHCQETPRPLGAAVTLTDGIFLLPERRTGTALSRSSQGTWEFFESGDLVNELTDRADGVWPYEAGRLRMRIGPVRTGMEYRAQSGDWTALPWEDGRSALDTILAATTAPGGADIVTPVGLVRVTQSAGRLRIDPGALDLRTGADVDTLADCVPANLDFAGQVFATDPASDSADLRLRCIDGRAFAETAPFGQADLNALRLLDDDPFHDRSAIAQSIWTWRQRQPVAGQGAFSVIEMQGETAGLAAGRFTFDEYRDLAAPFGRLAVVTSDGLREYPARTLALSAASRPDFVAIPQGINGAHHDRDTADGSARLCLSTETGAINYTQDGAPERVEECRSWRGQDGIWSYRHSAGDAPMAQATATNGPLIERSVQSGRFADLVASSLPLVLNDSVHMPTAIGLVELD